MKLISFLDAAPRSPFARMLWVVAACGVVTLLAWPWRDLLDPANTAALCAGGGRGGGSAAGVAAMGLEKIEFFWYVKKISLLAILGYIGGAATYVFL